MAGGKAVATVDSRTRHLKSMFESLGEEPCNGDGNQHGEASLLEVPVLPPVSERDQAKTQRDPDQAMAKITESAHRVVDERNIQKGAAELQRVHEFLLKKWNAEFVRHLTLKTPRPRTPPQRCPWPFRNFCAGGFLLDVSADQLGHLEHRDGSLAAENRFEFVVGVDVGSLLLVLEPVPLDVGPEFFGYLSARDGFGADDGAEGGVRLYRFHERRIRFAFLFCCCHFFPPSGMKIFSYVYSRGARPMPTIF